MTRFFRSIMAIALCAFIVQGLAVGTARAQSDEIDFLSHSTQKAAKEKASNNELDDVRGKSGLTFAAESQGVAVLSGVSTNNTVNGGVTGDNSISDSAFSNSTGISTVVQNSGNNVVVNSAFVVNVNMQQ